METRSSPSMIDLRAIASERGLKYYLHLPKPELFALLQRKQGGNVSTTLHLAMYEGNASQCGLSLKNRNDAKKKTEKGKRKQRIPMNDIDPIMLTELGPHTFEFTRNNGSIVAYNVESLVQYILATGNFSEPETRIIFSDEDLRRIDYKAKVAKLDAQSVLEAKRNKHIFDERKLKRDRILGLERCAGELVTSMLQVIEDEDAEEGELGLVMDIFPSFASIFNQLRENDAEYATQCMDHYKLYIQGPPNRPNQDLCGLRPAILDFLDSVLRKRQNERAFGF